MPWIPSPEQMKMYLYQYKINQLKKRFFLDFSEREELQSLQERLKAIKLRLAKTKSFEMEET